MSSRLIELSYFDPKSNVRLTAYADTIMVESAGGTGTITAIRFGGYPEMVRAMADAIYGGATIETVQNDKKRNLKSIPKKYRRQLAHDGVYATATLMASDDALTAEPQDVGEPGVLRQLEVFSLKEKLDAFVLNLKPEDANVVEILEDGLKSGAIAIPGTVPGQPDGFDGVENVTGYLNTFGTTVAQRIRGQFKPLFDPAAEPLSERWWENVAVAKRKSALPPWVRSRECTPPFLPEARPSTS